MSGFGGKADVPQTEILRPEIATSGPRKKCSRLRFLNRLKWHLSGFGSGQCTHSAEFWAT